MKIAIPDRHRLHTVQIEHERPVDSKFAPSKQWMCRQLQHVWHRPNFPGSHHSISFFIRIKEQIECISRHRARIYTKYVHISTAIVGKHIPICEKEFVCILHWAIRIEVTPKSKSKWVRANLPFIGIVANKRISFLFQFCARLSIVCQGCIRISVTNCMCRKETIDLSFHFLSLHELVLHWNSAKRVRVFFFFVLHFSWNSVFSEINSRAHSSETAIYSIFSPFLIFDHTKSIH